MRTLCKDVKKKKKKKMDVKNKAIKASNQRSNCPHGSFIIHRKFQRAVCKCQWQPLSLPGWKILRKSSNFCRFCLDFGFSAVIPEIGTCTYQKTWFGNIVRQRVSADLSRLEVRDSDMANQVEIAAYLFCNFSSHGRNNRKSLQRQIHFNFINHWGPTPTL